VAQLALLTINLGLALAFLVVAGIDQVVDPGWDSAEHPWIAAAVAVALLICAFRVFKRYVLIALLYTSIFAPPKPLKIGPLEIGAPTRAE